MANGLNGMMFKPCYKGRNRSNKVDCKGSATTKMMIWCSKPITTENIELHGKWVRSILSSSVVNPVSTTLRGFECESAQNSNMQRIEYLVKTWKYLIRNPYQLVFAT